MLKHISTGTFIGTLVVLTAGYYLIVGVLFYRSDFIKLFHKRNVPNPEPDNPAAQLSLFHKE